MQEIKEQNRKEYLEFACETSIEAGRITLEYFRKDFSVELKSDNSPVTIADRETENYIRNKIKRYYPEHGIIGEEFGEDSPNAGIQWTIDPIDGTRSFIYGIPLYTVLIALLYNGEPCLGVIHNPPLDETVAAAAGLGCRYNGSECMVSKTEKLSEANVQVTDYADLARRRPDFTSRLLKKSGFCQTLGDAYGYLLVASGRADVMIDPIMDIWDIAPMKPIITEAGGIFTDLDGNTNSLGSSALATNGILHNDILSLIK